MDLESPVSQQQFDFIQSPPQASGGRGINGIQQPSTASSSSVSSNNSQAMSEKRKSDMMLDIYIYDYLKKRNMEETAAVFFHESNLDQAEESVKIPIDLNNGFLYEWWTVFWDFYSARASKPSSAEAISFLHTMKQMTKSQQSAKANKFRPVSAVNNITPQQGKLSTSPSYPLETSPVESVQMPPQQQLQQHQQQPRQQTQQQHMNVNGRPPMATGNPMNSNQSVRTQSQLAIILSQYLTHAGVSAQQFNALPTEKKQHIVAKIQKMMPISMSQQNGIIMQHSQRSQQPQQQQLSQPIHYTQQQQQMKRPRTDDSMSMNMMPMQQQIDPAQMAMMQQFQRLTQQQHKAQMMRTSAMPAEAHSPQSASSQLVYEAHQQPQNGIVSPPHPRSHSAPPVQHLSTSGNNPHQQSFTDLVNGESADLPDDFDIAYLDALDPSQPIQLSKNQQNITNDSIPNTKNRHEPDGKDWNESEVESWLNLGDDLK